jgi:hypothetical protein
VEDDLPFRGRFIEHKCVFDHRNTKYGWIRKTVDGELSCGVYAVKLNARGGYMGRDDIVNAECETKDDIFNVLAEHLVQNG